MPFPRLLSIVALLFLLLCLAPVSAQPASDARPAPRIGVVTMQPGEIFFERFGHDALVVVDPASGQATSYNFGYFDPAEPDFIGNFIRGHMMYYLVALPLDEDLAQYRDDGRGASLQWLDLPPQQATALAEALAERAKPENARYRYDYFTANCATMVRDSLDQAMGGALQSQLAGRSRGNTYRSESVRLASPSPWMWLGFDLGLGPWADQPLSRWQEAFVPMRLADSLREVRNSEGRPLVQTEQELLPHWLAPEPGEHARVWWPWLLLGLAVAAALFHLRHKPRAVAGFALLFWLLCGVAGAVLTYLWGFSEHQAAWANRNLLLLNPLALVLIPGALRLLRGRQPGHWFGLVAGLLAVIALAALPVHWLSLQAQFNMQWIVLLLPIHLLLAAVLGKPALSAGSREQPA
ncbi:lipoprotein N-acyltransferase Lnb domain-containing protein [Stenotrophomonas sp. JC08]|uniref:lipoprotein N-acyltransferase Lnb domain-containing protein n=1 Tax=Stenotrophomonas sp. JC08 TaxID=3445779 RepID=UPI003FA33A32